MQVLSLVPSEQIALFEHDCKQLPKPIVHGVHASAMI